MDRKEVGESWVLAEDDEDGLSVIYRLRESVPDGIVIKDHSFLLSILWKYEFDGSSGIPSSELNEQQIAFDDALDGMDNTGLGIMMLVITGNGRREWVWYVTDPQQWLASLHECLTGHPVYPLDIQQSEDSEWATWKAFRDGMK